MSIEYSTPYKARKIALRSALEDETIKDEVIRLFENYTKDRSEANATAIYCFLKNHFSTLCNRNIEGEDVFQEIMLRLFNGGIEDYLALAKKSVSFRAYWVMNNRNIVTHSTNPNPNVASLYNILRKISEQYGIEIRKENAYKFARLSQRSDLTITRIMRIIEEQAVINRILYADSYDATQEKSEKRERKCSSYL